MAPTDGGRACLPVPEHTTPGRRTGPSVFVGARAPCPRVASGCHGRTLSWAWGQQNHRLGHGVPGAVDVSRIGRAHCPYAFSLRASRACYPLSGLDWHEPDFARFNSECPAPWTCAAVTGPTVFALFVCVLREFGQARTCCLQGAVCWVPDMCHGWVYQAGASATDGLHSPVAPTGIHMHTRAHIFISQTQIPVSGVLQCWLCMCQCQCSG